MFGQGFLAVLTFGSGRRIGSRGQGVRRQTHPSTKAAARGSVFSAKGQIHSAGAKDVSVPPARLEAIQHHAS
jgi:hypothetical protein